MDKEKEELEKRKTVYESSEIITTKVYKVSQEQKEELDRLSAERLERLSEGAIPRIRKRYEQMVKHRQQLSKADYDGKPPGDSPTGNNSSTLS